MRESGASSRLVGLPGPAPVHPYRNTTEKHRSDCKGERLERRRLTASGEREHRANRHHRIADERSAAVPEAHAHDALVIVIAVRIPYALSARQPPEKGHRGIAVERTEHEQRKPERPHVIAPSDDAEAGSEKAKGDRAH